ncbi:uncharacterized protein BO66DRAFT_393412 [Aspergillus aculeatinus CBS 121060]|uniref:Uncharacterized protein n=1 Tax=Aspergillus aculeatinus CBS 121060 TaxID=1448322 RepID=A0ACD1H357_9EURO|nr:hypothetical protein BO66DRAFT_393412 [Aspergillus aculeatinus CBS 121060]RAH67960.1 hypothetical protein BO66DRAFT_393412 [Aspergillus aculeatinus CBS 121060]
MPPKTAERQRLAGAGIAICHPSFGWIRPTHWHYRPHFSNFCQALSFEALSLEIWRVRGRFLGGDSRLVTTNPLEYHPWQSANRTLFPPCEATDTDTIREASCQKYAKRQSGTHWSHSISGSVQMTSEGMPIG